MSVASALSTRSRVSWLVVLALVVTCMAIQPSAAVGAGDLAQGTVTDAATGLPIPTASVGAYAVNPWGWIGNTDVYPDGTYNLYSSQGAGDYEVVAYAHGYRSKWQYPTWGGVTPLVLDFELTPAGMIASGTVTYSATGLPVAGARVVAMKDGVDLAGDAYTDSSGNYTLYDSYPMGAGVYRIFVVLNHYASTEFSGTWDGATPGDADLQVTWIEAGVIPIEGDDRIATAIAASVDGFESSEYVIVATGYNWPDALGGSALAGAYHAPILLTRQDSLPAGVAAEIARLKATKIIVLGGTPSVSATVFSQLGALPGVTVERIWGANRYETANKVAARTISVLEAGFGYGGHAFVATGANFPDALAASPLAAADGRPIYLANPAWGSNAALVATMKSAGVEEAVVLGGTGTVSPAVEAELDSALVSGASRIAGSNRYATAVKIAEMGCSECGLLWDEIGIATGENFPDALAGGVLQARKRSVLLLTPGKTLDNSVKACLASRTGRIYWLRFYGSTAACSDAVRNQVADALRP